MQITCVEENGVPRRTAILLDGELKKKVSHSIVSCRDLETLGHDEKFFEKLYEMEMKGAIRYALFCLSRQALHSKKLEKKLRSHFLDTKVIDATIASCQNHGFLNDEEWTEGRVRKWQSQGKSAADIHARLRRERAEIGKAVCNDSESLERLIPKKYPQLLDAKTPYKERMRAVQALQRRGFLYGSVQEFLQKKRITTMMALESNEEIES